MRRNGGLRLACCLLGFLALASPGAAGAQDAAGQGPNPPDPAAAPEAGAATAPGGAPAAAAGAAAEVPAASGGAAPAPADRGALMAASAKDPRAPRVRRAASDDPDPALSNRAGLDDLLTVEVERLAEGMAALGAGCKDFVLFLDGIPIEGSPPLSCNLADGRLRFHLVRTDRSDSAWHALLGEPRGFRRPVRVSVGPTSEQSWPTEVTQFELQMVPELPFFLFLALLVLGLAVFVRLARSTSLLRDPHAVPAPGGRAPYSLARFQLAFWSFLVIAAYVFLWLITEELDTITGSVLALLGIGAGTALGASLIDAGKTDAGAAPEPAAAEAVTTTAAPAAGGGLAAAASPATGVAVTTPPATQTSRGFLADLLNDERGVSLYRFQMFAWTLVLGIIFLASVYDKLAMPQFSPTLLGLMGISSGTFLGAKFPER